MIKTKDLHTIISENKRLLTGLVSGIFILGALIYGISYNLKRENDIADWVLRTQEEIYQIEKIISLAKDYETGSRGYLLTGLDAYEKPFTDASQALAASMEHLKRLTSNDAVQKNNLDSLAFYLDKKTRFSTTVIKLKREQSHEQALAYFSRPEGKLYMDSIRVFADKMHLHARQKLSDRKQDNEAAVNTINRILFTGIVFFAFLLLYAIWKSWQQQQDRKTAHHNLRIEKAFSEALLGASPDGMVGFNQYGKIVLFNHKAEALFGYSQQEILDASIYKLIPDQQYNAAVTGNGGFFKRVSELVSRQNSQEMLVQQKNGHTFPADIRLNLVNSHRGAMFIATIRDITQRKTAELQLKESEKNLQAILSSSQEAIYLLDLNFRLVLLNDHSYQIILQAYGIDCKPGDAFLEHFNPELRTNLMHIYTQVLAGKKVDVERSFQLHDGEAHYYSTYFPVKDTDGQIIGICCAGKNVTQRKKSEEAAQAANAEKEEYQSRFKAILDYSPQAILIKDTSGQHIFSNKSFANLVTFEAGEQLSPTLQTVLDDTTVLQEFGNTYTGEAAAILSSKQWQQQVILPNGRVLEMEIIKFPLYDRKQQLFGVCTLLKDITEQITHQQQLVAARENAEQAERLQEQFLANMSHELRTPMNGIIGMVNLLLTSSSLQPDQKGRLQVIKHSSDTLLTLINDILDLSKIKAGMLTIEQVTFDFNEAIASTALLFKEKAREKGIKLAVSADPFIPRYLTGDPHRLNQILNNLLSNAVKFTQEGFVRLEATLQNESNTQAIVEFTVSDSGIGIDEDKMDYIFDNFTQESADISSKFGGTGLGLAITKRLVELQGGEIQVQSVKSKGTTFTFTIPYAIAPDTAIVTTTNYQVKPETTRKNYHDRHALIVEDNEINQAVLTSSLQQHKMEVTIANNGQEAVDLLQAGHTYDIIFMDLRMPVMNGFQATAYIRQTLQLQIPIVVLTASVLRNERDRCLEIGASEYMAKPFSMSDLAIALDRFMPESESTDELQTIAAPVGKGYDAGNLLQLKNATYIRRILGLFKTNLPLYLTELKTLALENNTAAFLEKTHKIKGSLSAVQIEALYQDILQMEEEAPALENLNALTDRIDTCYTLCTSLLPTIEQEISETLEQLEATA